MSLCHHITASLCHHISQSFALPPATKPVSHLPCPLPPNQSVICLALYHRITASPHQSVICLAPCHQTSQSFDLPSTTASQGHHITGSPHHRVTTSPHHCITASMCHCISQSFALPPATKPVSHLPCPLPPNQSVICLALYYCVTTSPCHCITTSPHHCITMSVSHLPCPLPPNQSVI